MKLIVTSLRTTNIITDLDASKLSILSTVSNCLNNDEITADGITPLAVFDSTRGG